MVLAMSPWSPLSTVVTLVVCVAALAGCSESGASPDEVASTPDDGPTGLKAFDTGQLVVKRASFCEQIAEDAPARALGADVADTMAYSPGDTVEITAGVTDVADEWSCLFRTEDGTTTARAWLFAPPVTRARARALAESARGDSCSDIATGAPFGAPSVAFVCTQDKQRTASWQGLFGDAWLACSLSSKDLGRAELRSRASVWCVDVAQAASS